MAKEGKVKAPKVSICSQVYNQSEWLKEMIGSVRAQSLGNWELLIVDDGSTEDIKAVIEAFKDERIKYFRFDENKGIPFGTNYAMTQAQGEYICLMAADEIYHKDKLLVQTQYLDANKQVDACWGLPGSGSEQQFPLGQRPEWEQYALLAHNRSREQWLKTLLNLEHIPIGGLGLVMRKSAADKLGPMDESLTIFSDHEWYCRFFWQGFKGAILPYRAGIDKPASKDTVRVKNQHKANDELAYVRSKYPLPIPEVKGKITVGIPCYNQAKFLPDVVASVLGQTMQVDEIMILDDCSTDDFKTVVQQFTDPRIKIMAFDENRGVQEAINQMAFRAEGEFFLFISADDTIDATLVEKCMARFEADPWLEMVATQTDFLMEDMKTPAPQDHPFRSIRVPVNKPREQWLTELYEGNQYFGVGMYRTAAISEVGGWEKQYKVISDYQMYLKLLQRGNIYVIEEPLTHTRCHEAQSSLLKTKERQKELPWLYHEARKPFYRKRMKVVIATPFYELKGFSPYIRSLVDTTRLMTQIGMDWRFMELSGDSYVHRARNTMVDAFLADPDATDLLFVDSDMSWNPEALVNMCLLPDEVVGGSYPVKNNWKAWTSIPKMTQEQDGTTSMQGRPLQDGSALIEAQVLAGGFLRIKRSVFEKFKEKYKDLWYVEPTTDPSEPEKKYTAFFGAESIDHKFYGEDHCFAKRLREMDIKMFIYPNANIVHWGYHPFAGNYHNWVKENFATDVSKVRAATMNEPGQRMTQ